MTETTTTASAGSAANASPTEQGPSLLLRAYPVSPPYYSTPSYLPFDARRCSTHLGYVTPMQIKTFSRLQTESFHRRCFLWLFMECETLPYPVRMCVRRCLRVLWLQRAVITNSRPKASLRYQGDPSVLYRQPINEWTVTGICWTEDFVYSITNNAEVIHGQCRPSVCFQCGVVQYLLCQ